MDMKKAFKLVDLVYTIGKEVLDVLIPKKAKDEVRDIYQGMLAEIFLNVVALFLLSFVAPLFFEMNTVKNMIVTYYIFTILRTIYINLDTISCTKDNGFNIHGILECLIIKKRPIIGRIWKSKIKEAILPTVINIIITSVLYVVLFRFWALPYFVEDTTGMSLFELVFNSVWLPISEFFSMIFHFVF